VTRLLELERRLGFDRSSIPEIGRLLHVLAAQRGRAHAGEISSRRVLSAIELLTTPQTAAIVATRLV
jgi:hypothetical protein